VSGTLVIGVGQELRGDDAVGLLVARRVARGAGPEVCVVEHDGDGMDLVLRFEAAEHVVLVDAVMSEGGSPGDVHRFDAHAAPLPASVFSSTSTHALGVADAVEMARAMERLPRRLVVYGVESACFDIGSAPRAEVLAAVEPVAERVREEIARGPSCDA
jgi:hydrogenase maturation protease